MHMNAMTSNPEKKIRCWSLTLWLTVCNALSAFSILALISALLYGGLAEQLRNQNHLYLHDEVNSIENMLSSPGHGLTLAKELGPHHSGLEYVKHYIRLMDRDERVLQETPGMAEVIPEHSFPVPPRSARPGADRASRAANGNAVLSTVGWVELEPGSGKYGILQVALDVTNVDELLVGYRNKVYLMLCFGILLCVGVSFAIARRGTRPLGEMAGQVRRITATNLEDRVSGSDWPCELDELADAMNLTLERLEDSFTRLYNSATNLSHKMRTPLTIMRGEAEVALSRKRSAEELEDVIASGLEEVGRLSRLAENILFLANAELGKFQVERAVLDCREEVDTMLDYYSPLAEEKGISLTCQGGASLVVDSTLFCKSLAALISNAITYNEPGGSVALTLRQGDGLSGELSITDSGCGIPECEKTKVFDRFYRIYATRHMDPHGTGLGLPMVKAVVDLHDGMISLQSIPGQGTTVTLSFPEYLS